MCKILQKDEEGRRREFHKATKPGGNDISNTISMNDTHTASEDLLSV